LLIDITKANEKTEGLSHALSKVKADLLSSSTELT